MYYVVAQYVVLVQELKFMQIVIVSVKQLILQ